VAGPPAALAAVRSAVRSACADLAPGALVLVACSGGPDSLALAAAAGWLAASPRGPGWRAGAVVVDHGLQPGSADAAARAASACTGLGLDPVEVVAVAVATGPGAGGPEAAARSARYAALDAAAERHGAEAVLVGHTRDDQAEQVLLGLARGSGARSLAGMPARRGRHRRPLLGLPRATTSQACAAAGLVPWSDPANADPSLARVRVRTRLLPALEADLGPGVAAALARTADQLREDADVLEPLAAQLLLTAGGAAGGGAGADRVDLDVAVLAAAPAALRRRALRAAALDAGSPAADLHRDHVLAVDALVTAWRGQGAQHLPGRVRAWRACGTLSLARWPAGPAS
jgi:tRNA(Ile)-lysidine synthase